MMHLSYQEAYVLWFVSQMKDCIDPRKLLGLYVCHFLDDLEAREIEANEDGYADEYLLQSGEALFGKNLLTPILKRLIDLTLLKVERERIFKHFLRIQLVGEGERIDKGDLNKFILEALQNHKPLQNAQKLQTIIEVFNTKLFSFLQSLEAAGEKFELRFFWPESIVPEVYVIGGLFKEGEYKKDREKDLYLIEKENAVLKMRGDQLQEKCCTYDFYGISRFTKKKKVDISAEKAGLLYGQAVEVTKKKYLYKGEPQVKIEFASLKVQGEKWRTICIESPSLQTVLAFSLLINSDYGKTQNYAAFVKDLSP